ncbi:2OG-Fe(II) oxygenase family protein [Pseudaminobacter salicylatoxidans]|uniref:2OG-Fe(II) oxygenase family protein n=1 Tax=Pseudaminobacter salicylatoxidans TaxID=93369 RepID=UPI001FCBEE6F|nr:2OG-Fe(II) oxygenase family protein [Pseudaminobacter salicylatoxidans]
MRLFAVALKLPEDYFERFIDAPISALRALNYPEQTVPPKPGQLRAGAHTDYGSLTILLPQEGSKGLELITPGGNWTPVPPVPGAFVINIGDLMALWTNDRWVSTMHRVVNPSPEDGGMDRRQSLAFFHQPTGTPRSSASNSALHRAKSRNTSRCARVPILWASSSRRPGNAPKWVGPHEAARIPVRYEALCLRRTPGYRSGRGRG